MALLRGACRSLLIVVGLLSLAAGATAQTVAPAKADSPARATAENDQLRGGWYPWDPYQYFDYSRGVPLLTGFDIEIQRALARRMGLDITMPQVLWEDHLTALANGTADLAAGATRSEARERYAWFSKPYRTETEVLIVPRGASDGLPFRTVDSMLEWFAGKQFRLGVVTGYLYADPRINAFIADPANRKRIVTVLSDGQNLRNLQAGTIDGFLGDRISVSTTAWRRGEGARVEEHPLRFSTDLHFMLSRATQTPERLAQLDAAIDDLRQSGEYQRIARAYVLPVLINQTLDSDWFQLLVLIGTVAFALSGVMLAYEGQYTLVGAMILAVLPAVGGGVVRDLVLQRNPIGIVRHPEALLIVFGTVVAGMMIVKVVSRLQSSPVARYLHARTGVGGRSIEISDAVGLAAFTVTGVVVVLDTPAQPLWLWGPIGAVLTSSFGGLMRDLFRHDGVIANLRGELYAEIALVWGLAFSLFLEWEGRRLQPEEIALGVIVTVLGAFATRMIAIVRRTKGWRYA
jgi:polar amino acid transport system substrate-binding protein